jgi:hypothetical protein
MLLTERDAQIVAWIGGMGAVGAEHVRRRFDIGSISTVYRRLRLLTADGLLDHRTVLDGWPGVYSATREGMRWQGLEGQRVFKVKDGQFKHTWQVGHTAAELHCALPGWEVIGERGILAIESNQDDLYASIRLAGRSKGKMFHRPDLALALPGVGVVAVEVELSVKARPAINAICRGWARARHIDRVYYLALPKPARSVRKAVKATMAEDRIRVLDLDDIETLAAELSVRADAAGHVDDRGGDAAAKV